MAFVAGKASRAEHAKAPSRLTKRARKFNDVISAPGKHPVLLPTTLPGLSITKGAELLQMQNKIIKSFPKVQSVLGKVGRASTATDPAPWRCSRPSSI